MVPAVEGRVHMAIETDKVTVKIQPKPIVKEAACQSNPYDDKPVAL